MSYPAQHTTQQTYLRGGPGPVLPASLLQQPQSTASQQQQHVSLSYNMRDFNSTRHLNVGAMGIVNESGGGGGAGGQATSGAYFSSISATAGGAGGNGNNNMFSESMGGGAG